MERDASHGRIMEAQHMLFPTFIFAAFFMIVWPLNWILMRHPSRWRALMLVSGYVFYAWWDWRFAFLLAASTLANQFFAVHVSKASDPRHRKAVLVAAVTVNLAVLAWFKYFNFFVTSAANLLSDVGISWAAPTVTTILPVGISFFTFMALSYVIDAYRGTFQPTSLSRFAVFLSFFPHIVAGPIVRPAELVPQFDTPRDPRKIDASRAFFLIAGGMFKKVVIAGYMATFADPIFTSPATHSAPQVIVGVWAYAIQIYADFSGYTDMAIGIALLMGFNFPLNFNRPYSADGLRDFWRRWHMTLSRWLRDYLYIPLGGNRKGEARTSVNLLATMVLGGLWHGAAWTFLAWGTLHGVGLVTEHRLAARRERTGARFNPPVWLVRLATLCFVVFAWIFFRATSFTNAFDVIGQIFTGWGTAGAASLGAIAVIAGMITAQQLRGRLGDKLMASFSRVHWAAQGVALGAVLMVIGALSPSGVAPFIYFQF